MSSIMIIAGLAVGMAASPVLDGVGVDAVNAPLVLVQSDGGVDCRSAAYRVVEDVGGQLLSVRQSGNECVITVLIPGNGNERPRKVTMRVSK
ncbi:MULTISPECIES: hypothetical protein [Alphaproteobacteria]|uniref:Uncharacterized protein n=2 Tax=Alphaproteobacteria TaxID=28211 RepID=A0A512HG76_9HYPH|nr:MULTISPECIES: hypothetical protein [Alphaproteobacteria]GEO84390.1 hypothetical protein RNA01_13220 [Ciceribacter naphthalenivorans]GLR22353.1 hypothetical protein GCM10007920_21400 [Ciceribacter naphthalenivorans]GLT05209.1 hypothetical protein GCM10007926_21400 [Sphingomonas psychrolutea]